MSDIRATVQPVMSRVDGSAMTPEEVLRIRVQLSLNGGASYVDLDPILPPFAPKVLIQNAQPGVRYMFKFSVIASDGVGGSVESETAAAGEITPGQVTPQPKAAPNAPTLVELVEV